MSEANDLTAAAAQRNIIDQRTKTELIAQYLQEQLSGYLETLRPLLAADRFLGKKFIGPKGEPTWSDRAYSDLQLEYKKICGNLNLLPEFNAEWLTLVNNRLELQRWEYVHSAKSDGETRAITMSSPVRWVLSYKSDLTLAQFRQAFAQRAEGRGEHFRQFVVNALMLQQAMARVPGLNQLLAALRFQVKIEPTPELGNLPLVTISSALPSFRPSDEQILAVAALSGVPAFIELIDFDPAHLPADPLQKKLRELVR